MKREPLWAFEEPTSSEVRNISTSCGIKASSSVLRSLENALMETLGGFKGICFTAAVFARENNQQNHPFKHGIKETRKILTTPHFHPNAEYKMHQRTSLNQDNECGVFSGLLFLSHRNS